MTTTGPARRASSQPGRATGAAAAEEMERAEQAEGGAAGCVECAPQRTPGAHDDVATQAAAWVARRRLSLCHPAAAGEQPPGSLPVRGLAGFFCC